MYIEDGVLKGRYGNNIAEGTTVIPPWSWTQLVMRYNAEGKSREESYLLRLKELLHLSYIHSPVEFTTFISSAL